MFAHIIELYEEIDSHTIRRKRYRNKGMASFRMLDDIAMIYRLYVFFINGHFNMVGKRLTVV